MVGIISLSTLVKLQMFQILVVRLAVCFDSQMPYKCVNRSVVQLNGQQVCLEVDASCVGLCVATHLFVWWRE